MSIPSVSVRHPVTTTMVFAAFSILGIASLFRVGQELFPDVELPTMVVITVSPGIAPAEMESQVSEPIEDAVASINGIETISSTSSDSVSQVVLGFNESVDLAEKLIDVREVLTEIEDSFPEGTERSAIFKWSASNLPSLEMNVISSVPGIDVRRLAEDVLVPAIERVPGVGQAQIFGGRTEAVLVQLDLDAITKTGIPITQVLQAFSGENVSLPAGSVASDDRTVSLRTVGEFESVGDIGSVLVGYREQIPVFLADIATIELTYEPQAQYAQSRGGDAVRISVQKQPDYNTVDVNDAVLEAVDAAKALLPPSVTIEVQSNQADSVRDSIGGVASAGWQGGLLAIIILLVFLRNVRSTLIVSTVIPVAVIATMSLIDFAGMTLNIVSLMGITLAIGMFVDNAIVVLESIFRKQLTGLDARRAAIEGAEEVAKAVTASTLTSMAVFLPMLFVGGMAGALFEDLSLTIAFSLFMSLAAALSLTPVLSSVFLKVTPVVASGGAKLAEHEVSLADVEVTSKSRVIQALSNAIKWGLERLDEGYEWLISWALDHKGQVLLYAVLLLALSVGSVLLLGMEFLPEADEGAFTVAFRTRDDASSAFSLDRALAIERIVTEVAGDDLETVALTVGGSGGASMNARAANEGAVFATLTPVQGRRRDIWEITREIDRRVAAEVLDVDHRIQIEGMSALAAEGGGGGSAIQIRIQGRDLDQLARIGEALEAEIEQVPGTRNVRSSFQQGVPERRFVIQRREAVSLGLSAREIATTIRAAYNGVDVTTFRTEDGEYDVMVILEESDRTDLDRVRNLFLVNRAGELIPMENLVDIDDGRGPQSISRFGRERVIEVRGALDGTRALSDVTDDVEAIITALGAPPPGVTISVEGSAAEMGTSFRSLALALLLAVALVYMVMASQFESFINPLIVMASVPFAAIGLVVALLITNTTFSILAFAGAILLVGIVVNNAIVLIDYMDTLQSRGVPLREAIVKGGRTRLKPILMTTMTTVLGLIPMALGLGAGAELRYPMGRAVVGGLLTSTLITLVVIPTLYAVVEGRRRAIRERREERGAA